MLAQKFDLISSPNFLIPCEKVGSGYETTVLFKASTMPLGLLQCNLLRSYLNQLKLKANSLLNIELTVGTSVSWEWQWYTCNKLCIFKMRDVVMNYCLDQATGYARGLLSNAWLLTFQIDYATAVNWRRRQINAAPRGLIADNLLVCCSLSHPHITSGHSPSYFLFKDFVAKQ